MALTVSDLSPQLSGKPHGCALHTNRKLAVRFIPPGTTKDELFFKFKQYGAIQSIALLPQRPGARYCFGFVEYSSHMSACTAKLELDSTNWGDCMVSVEWAQPKERASLAPARDGAAGAASRIHNGRCNVLEEGCVVQVKNIPITVTQCMLRQLFSKCGKIKTLYMCALPPNAPPPQAFSGFVQFSRAEEADRALAELDGKLLHGNLITVQALRMFSGVKSSMPTEFHPNTSARERITCPCPLTVRPSIPINVLRDYSVMRFGCPPFGPETSDGGARKASDDMGCTAISCSLDNSPGILAWSQACTGGSPVASRAALESVCAVGVGALSSVPISASSDDVAESSTPSLSCHSSPSHATQSGRSFLNTHRGRVLARALESLKGCSPPGGKQQESALACRLSTPGTESDMSPVQPALSSPPGTRSDMSPVQPMLPPGTMSPVQPVLPPGTRSALSPVQPVLPPGTMSPVQPVLPPGTMSPVQPVLPPGTRSDMSPVQPVLPPGTRSALSPVQPVLPTGTRSDMSPVQPVLPPGTRSDMSPVQPVLPPGTRSIMSPVQPVLSPGTRSNMSPVQPVLSPGTRSDMSPVQPVLPPGTRSDMSPVEASFSLHSSQQLSPPSLHSPTSLLSLPTFSAQMLCPPVWPQLSPSPPPAPPSPLSPPTPSQLQLQAPQVQSMPSNGEMSLFNSDVETNLSMCVDVNDRDTRRLVNNRASASAFQMESPALLTQMESPYHPTQLPVTQMGSPGFSVQTECPMQAECSGLTANVESFCLSTTQFVSSDMETNVCMSVPASFLNASLQVGSNKEAVSTHVSLQTVARRRRAVRIAAVFPGDEKGGGIVSVGRQRGEGPTMFPEQDVEPARCSQGCVETTEDHVKLARCQKEGVEPRQCQEDCAEATRCPQEGIEPTGCQLGGTELSWFQREDPAPIRLQEGDTLSGMPEDPQHPKSAQQDPKSAQQDPKSAQQDPKSAHERFQGSRLDYGTSVDPLILPDSFSEVSLEAESDSSICVSSSVPDPSLSHSCSSCESTLCLSVGCAPNSLDQTNGREENEPSNGKEEESELSSHREEEERLPGSCGISRQDHSIDRFPKLFQACPRRAEMGVGTCSTHQSSNVFTSELPSLSVSALCSSDVSVPLAQPNELDLLSPQPMRHAGVQFGTREPGMGGCGSPGPGVWAESDLLSPEHSTATLDNSVFTMDKHCVLSQPCPHEGVADWSDSAGRSAMCSVASACLNDLKRTATKLQADLEKICCKNKKTSDLIEAEMSALDQEKSEPCLPLGIQPERLEMYDRIIHLHAQWVFKHQWVRYREEQEKAAVLGAEKKWGKDSKCFLEFKLCQQIDTLKAQLSVAQLQANELQLKQEFYAT
ncbi:hypothetical protein EMCRGX_G033962 [Ephydatia muelleri]